MQHEVYADADALTKHAELTASDQEDYTASTEPVGTTVVLIFRALLT